jgi:hypothetical protein
MDRFARNDVVIFDARYHGCADEFNDAGSDGSSD